MPPRIRNILAVTAGVITGSLVNMAIVSIGTDLIPPPEWLDLTDMKAVQENSKKLAPVHFIAPWLAHAMGTLVAAFIAAKLAASHRMKFALGMGVWFLAGGIVMVLLVGGPMWFTAADLGAAYLPMAFLGGVLAGALKSPPV